MKFIFYVLFIEATILFHINLTQKAVWFRISLYFPEKSCKLHLLWWKVPPGGEKEHNLMEKGNFLWLYGI